MVRRTDAQEALTSLIAPVYILASIVQNGLGSFSLDIGSSFALSNQLVSLGGSNSLTYAAFLSMLALGIGYVVNDNDFSDFSDVQTYVASATLAIIVLTALVPALSSFITSSIAVGAGVFLLEAFGFAVIAGYNG